MALGELQVKSAIPELTKELDDSTEVAAESLTTLGDPTGRDVLISGEDPDDTVIQLLEWALKNESRYVCLQTEQELGARGNAGSIEKLEPLLKDEHTQLRVMAAASIIRIMDRDGKPGEVLAGPVAPVMQPKK
jgi:HEAT repeat protein